VAGGVLSVLAALLHLGVIAGGPDWYRFFGAGEEMARMAERGSPTPAIITVGIAALLISWAVYAFSAAGLLPRLPLMRTALVLISAVYLLRGLVLIPAFVVKGFRMDAFTFWSSLIVLVYGICYALGTRRAWSTLSRAPAHG
jgi:hypothetical protein